MDVLQQCYTEREGQERAIIVNKQKHREEIHHIMLGLGGERGNRGFMLSAVNMVIMVYNSFDRNLIKQLNKNKTAMYYLPLFKENMLQESMLCINSIYPYGLLSIWC